MDRARALVRVACGIDVEHERREHEAALEAEVGGEIDDVATLRARKLTDRDEHVQVAVVSARAARARAEEDEPAQPIPEARPKRRPQGSE